MSYRLKITLVFIGICFIRGLTTGQSVQDNELKARVLESLRLSGFSELQLTDIQIASQAESQRTRIKHIYVNQLYKGVRIEKAVGNFIEKEGKLTLVNSTFVHLKNVATAEFPKSEAREGLTHALALYHLKPTAAASKRSTVSNINYFQALGSHTNELMVEGVWLFKDQALIPAWKSTLDLPAPHADMLEIYTAAGSGQLIKKYSLKVECQFERPMPNKPNEVAVDPKLEPSVANSYQVFDLPVESPYHGPRTASSSPWTRTGAGNNASTLGWHNDNVTNYNITRGNNVYAYEDQDNNNVVGYSPSGGASLDFNFPFSIYANPFDQIDAGLTNLFHTCNLTHDILYQYGFDEVSGNFQNSNLGRGGTGIDYVPAEGFDGGGYNNANFATPADGSRPRMQMYIWSTSIEISIDSPMVATTLSAVESGFSTNNKILQTGNLGGYLVLANDSLACSALSNGAAINGKIALIYRGSCNFTDKVKNAQNAGAIAAIVINNIPGDPAFGMGGADNTINIPAAMVSYEDGALLKSYLGQNVKISINALRTPDGNYDNGIIIHEYGHGVSNRLVGGPSNVNCLNNQEQMGEGWSDFLALMLTTDWANASETTSRGIGTYALDEEISGTGIRTYPYSTNMAINPFTYGDVASAPVDELGSPSPHFIGSIWATMLWDMTWKIIETEGVDGDIYHGTGGNNIALELVMEGLKQTACSPGFVDGRDAILLADEMLYGGSHKCAIWNAFGRRGLGLSASQGSSGSFTDGAEAFDIPDGVESQLQLISDVSELSEFEINRTLTNGCGLKSNFHFEEVLDPGLQLKEVIVGAESGGKVISSTSDLLPGASTSVQYKVFASPCTGSQVLVVDQAEGSNQFSSVNLGSGSRSWAKTTSQAKTPSQSWYGQNYFTSSDYALTQINGLLLTKDSYLSFYHKFETEAGYDGGVVEISANGGPWQDLETSFIYNGYASFFLNTGALPNRPAFTGASSDQFGTSDFILSVVDLNAFTGQNIKIRFRFKSDGLIAGSGINGWYIDDIQINAGMSIGTQSFSGFEDLGSKIHQLVFARPNEITTAYVDPQAAGLGDATSWINGHPSLAQVLALAHCRNVETIYLAEGSYSPFDNRDSSFVLPDGISIFGGFQHGTAIRNIQNFESILSGDIGFAGSTDNSYHVLKTLPGVADILLDGISVKFGNASGGGINAYGGGLFNQGQVILRDVKFSQNEGQNPVYNALGASLEVEGSTQIEP